MQTPEFKEKRKETQFKPGQSGNPAGKPKGTKHLTTWIQELMNDEEFTTWVPDAKEGWKEYKGAPIKAVVQAQLNLALKGDAKAFDLLGKYGYGTRQEIDITSGGEKIEFNSDRAEQLIRARGSRTDIQGISS